MSPVIDFHTHCFPDKIASRALSKLSAASHVTPFTGGTAADLSASARAAGVDLSIILPVATSPGQVASINDFAARLNESTVQTGLFSFGGAHPDDPDWHGHLSQVSDLGLKGIKLHPVYQGVDLDDPRYLRILDRAGELGLTVVTHAGDDIGIPGVVHCSPEITLRAVRQAGPVRLVLAHMGGWLQWEQAEALLAGTSVYLDTSFSTGTICGQPMLDEAAFLRMARSFGTDRLLFGTDSPWSGQRESLDWLRALPLTDIEKAAILGGNAAKLLGI